jgi:hypothetical protein
MGVEEGGYGFPLFSKDLKPNDLFFFLLLVGFENSPPLSGFS